MKLSCAAAAAAFALATPALAQSPLAGTDFYGTLGYTHLTGDADGIDLGLGSVTGRVGARFTRWIGVEVEGSVGAGSDQVDVEGVPVTVDLRHQFAAYVVGFAPVSERFDLIARLGLSTAELEVAALQQKEAAEGQTVNVGVGGQLWFDENNAGRLEYTRWLDEEGDIDTVSLSYVRRF